MTSKKVKHVGEFIRRIHESLVPGSPLLGHQFFISKSGEGSLSLDTDERTAFSSTVDRLSEQFVDHEDMSRRSVERYLQDALFDSLDIQEKSPKDFDTRLTKALSTLDRQLSSAPLSYRCFIPVVGFNPAELPFVFGATRFVRFGKSHQRSLDKASASSPYMDSSLWSSKKTVTQDPSERLQSYIRPVRGGGFPPGQYG